MTRTDPMASERSIVSPNWWTPRRTKRAGLGGIVGGVGLLALSIGRTGAGFDFGAVNLLSPVGYVMVTVTLLAANARYGSDYGRRGRIVAAVFAVSLSSYAASIPVLVASRAVFGSVLVPVGILAGTAFLVMRLFGSLYGVFLWRRTTLSRLTAALFVSILPALFVLTPLAVFGYPAVWVEAPLSLAGIALGYELLTVGEKGSEADAR